MQERENGKIPDHSRIILVGELISVTACISCRKKQVQCRGTGHPPTTENFVVTLFASSKHNMGIIPPILFHNMLLDKVSIAAAMGTTHQLTYIDGLLKVSGLIYIKENCAVQVGHTVRCGNRVRGDFRWVCSLVVCAVV